MWFKMSPCFVTPLQGIVVYYNPDWVQGGYLCWQKYYWFSYFSPIFLYKFSYFSYFLNPEFPSFLFFWATMPLDTLLSFCVLNTKKMKWLTDYESRWLRDYRVWWYVYVFSTDSSYLNKTLFLGDYCYSWTSRLYGPLGIEESGQLWRGGRCREVETRVIRAIYMRKNKMRST